MSIEYMQPDQVNMAMLFWYLVKSDLSSVGYYTRVHWTSHLIQGTRNTRLCITGHSVADQKLELISQKLVLISQKLELISQKLELISQKLIYLEWREVCEEQPVPRAQHDVLQLYVPVADA